MLKIFTDKPADAIAIGKDFSREGLYNPEAAPDRCQAEEEDITQRGAGGVEHRRYVANWVAREILPHEARIRTWFARFRLSREDVDELLQEAYCRIADLDAVDHIAVPQAYFFSIARNLLLRRLKRQRIIPFESIAEIEGYRDGASSPEQAVSTKIEYERILALIASLPDKCRRIVELRKIEGWSQKEIAEHFGMSEKAVEKQVWLGVRAVRQAWDLVEQQGDAHLSHLERAAVRGQ